MKHAPGPWEIGELEGELRDGFLPIGSNNEVVLENGLVWGPVCEVYFPFEDHYMTEIAKANAKLIAASPLLLDACKQAIELLEEKVDEWELIDHDFSGCNEKVCPLCALRNAVKAAEGE